MMSNNRSVFVLKDDFTNPFKFDLCTSNIKSTLTFWGFCKYHDRSLFQGIENKNTTHYNVEDVFCFSYRALAKVFSDNRELIEKYSWMNRNWKSEQKKRLDKEWAAFQSCRMKNIDKNLVQLKLKFWLIYFARRVVDKQRIKVELIKCHMQKRRLERKLKRFNNLINKGEIFESHYVIFYNDNQMAFSTAFIFFVDKRDVFLYFTSLPQLDGSLMIISCSRSDYEYIKDDPGIKELFLGNENIINIFLNCFKEKIAINGTKELSEHVDPFFLEWDIPLAIIPYFKLRNILKM